MTHNRAYVYTRGNKDISNLIYNKGIEVGASPLAEDTVNSSAVLFFEYNGDRLITTYLSMNTASMKENENWIKRNQSYCGAELDVWAMIAWLEEMKQELTKTHTVRLNDSYDATYTEGDDYIYVGCQKFHKDQLIELYETVFED